MGARSWKNAHAKQLKRAQHHFIVCISFVYNDLCLTSPCKKALFSWSIVLLRVQTNKLLLSWVLFDLYARFVSTCRFGCIHYDTLVMARTSNTLSFFLTIAARSGPNCPSYSISNEKFSPKLGCCIPNTQPTLTMIITN